MKRISYEEFSKKRTDAMRLLDVREQHEYDEVHVKGAELFPLSRLQAGDLPPKDDRELYVICRSGARSQAAAQLLESNGFEECTNVDGGTLAAVAMGDDHVE